MTGKIPAAEILKTAQEIMTREGRVTSAALACALGIAQSSASRWISQLRREHRWPFPFVKPGDHGPQPARRRTALSAVDSHSGTLPSLPPRRHRGHGLSLEEWRRRAWPAIFGVPFVPCAPPPPVTSGFQVVGWDETAVDLDADPRNSRRPSDV